MMPNKKAIYGLIASTLLSISPSNAEGTWILAAHGDLRKPSPGTIGEQYGIWGMGWYVDVKSIAKRGNRAYFNSSTVILGEGKKPCSRTSCGWDFSKGAPTKITSNIANCSTKQLIDAQGLPAGKQGEITNRIASFACAN
jgi:hypothetical protein